MDKYQIAWNYITLEKLVTVSSSESRENSSNSLWAFVVIFFKMYWKLLLWIKETESVATELQVHHAVREQWRFLDNWAFPFYVLRLIFSSFKKNSLCAITYKMYCKCPMFVNRLNHNTFTVPPWLQWPWLSAYTVLFLSRGFVSDCIGLPFYILNSLISVPSVGLLKFSPIFCRLLS